MARGVVWFPIKRRRHVFHDAGQIFDPPHRAPNRIRGVVRRPKCAIAFGLGG